MRSCGSSAAIEERLAEMMREDNLAVQSAAAESLVTSGGRHGLDVISINVWKILMPTTFLTCGESSTIYETCLFFDEPRR